jgi:hypothetical protein
VAAAEIVYAVTEDGAVVFLDYPLVLACLSGVADTALGAAGISRHLRLRGQSGQQSAHRR